MVSLKDGADLGLGGDCGGGGEGGNGRIIQAVGVVVVGECVIEGVELFGEVGECLDGDGPGAMCAVLEDRRAGVGAPVEQKEKGHHCFSVRSLAWNTKSKI